MSTSSPSPTSDMTSAESTSTNSSNPSSENDLDTGPNTKCTICNETYTIPKVLSCFHTFCQPCLEKLQETPDKITCVGCRQDTLLGPLGLHGLVPDFAVSNILEENDVTDTSALHCTGCKTKDTNAVARCFDCANLLCANCVMAHQFMHCFEGHHVRYLADLQNKDAKIEKTVQCLKHKHDALKYFCLTCNIPICQECTVVDHANGHNYEIISEISDGIVEKIHQMSEDSKNKANSLRGLSKSIEHTSNHLQIHYHKAQNEINETYNFYRSMIEERKQEVLKELDGAYNAKQVTLSAIATKMQDSTDKLYQAAEFVDKLKGHTSSSELLVYKKLLDDKLDGLLNYFPDQNIQNMFDMEFVSNYQAIQVGVRNTFGYVRQNADKPAPIARPNTVIQNHNRKNRIMSDTSGLMNGQHHGQLIDTHSLIKRFSTNNLLNFPPPPSLPSPTEQKVSYDTWSPGIDIMQNGGQGGGDVFTTSADPIVDLTSKLITANIYPPKSQLKRQKMIYHCKFGEFGVMEGQFTEPSGVAINAQNDIIVADTNNHRIQIFDREGRFKFQFGECGKRDGQLLYPNRVAVVRTSGDIIVTERSPTHQVQIYNQYGQFVRKFGANILQHPRGVTVDSKGHIIIVECKVMRVIIFDLFGNVLQKFGCSKHLEFPNGVVVNDQEEIFISDNRAHCVKVFSYQGVFLRQIGGEGVTNYPIGVGINLAGEILIADNHNNFNVTMFTQDGHFLHAFESKVKHAQCFDVALMDDGSIVLASKDYRLYIYRYMQLPVFPM
ncbi:unnamed protein product [Owenia fusiformis]|uniref:Uncharacterized protein n=1 Tax=Owenia fusiformis TaxID=6347 RepID=A0A8J1THD5_OWEFU|nr:unnamed protein product [Owenia fusiformis]